MRVVTTCHEAGFEQYGHRALAGWKHWPRDAELHWYTEGYEIPSTPGVVAVPIEQIQSLARFKERHAGFVPPSYIWDVVRFSNKVFAACDALASYKGIGVWMDADCVTYADIPAGYVEGLLERDAYLGAFQRTGMYTETGFWVMDCSHVQHEAFVGVWQEWYDSAAFKSLGGWTDCHTLDATIRKFKGLIKVTNLSGAFAAEMHPMAKADLGRFVDHTKGPRKDGGTSPENTFRQAA